MRVLVLRLLFEQLRLEVPPPDEAYFIISGHCEILKDYNIEYHTGMKTALLFPRAKAILWKRNSRSSSRAPSRRSSTTVKV